MTIELISHYTIGVLSIILKFLVLGIFGSEEEILQKITPWRKNQVSDFYAAVLFSNIYGTPENPKNPKSKTNIETRFFSGSNLWSIRILISFDRFKKMENDHLV